MARLVGRAYIDHTLIHCPGAYGDVLAAQASKIVPDLRPIGGSERIYIAIARANIDDTAINDGRRYHRRTRLELPMSSTIGGIERIDLAIRRTKVDSASSNSYRGRNGSSLGLEAPEEFSVLGLQPVHCPIP